MINLDRKLRLGIDIDETLIPTVEKIIVEYNKKYNKKLKYKDIVDWDLSKSVHIPTMDLFQEFATEEFYNTIKPYPYAIEFIDLLYSTGKVDIYFVSAGHSITFHWRHKLLSKLFDWYADKMLIKCSNKQLLNLDYLIDDCPFNLTDGLYAGIIKTVPWNKDCKDFERLDSWKEWYNQLVELLKEVNVSCDK